MTRTMRRPYRLLLAALLAVALVATAASPAGGYPRGIKGTWERSFEEGHHGTSVAIGPDGTAWFGVSAQGGTELAHARPGSGAIESDALTTDEGWGATGSLQFDAAGNLWFSEQREDSRMIVRRDPTGGLSEFKLPGTATVGSVAIGPDGMIWFTRVTYDGHSAVGRMTPAGAVTEFALPTDSHPRSIVIGPEGAAWFAEREPGQIGRATASGEVTLLPLAAGIEPRQIVVGPDGALWFSENGRVGRHRTKHARLGRITTSGEVTQFPIPFGEETEAIATDPRGFIWFTTKYGELSSISPAGKIGGRNCLGCGGVPIPSIAVAPWGTLWFTTGTYDCSGCGGGAALMAQNAGTSVGRIPAGRTPRLPTF